MTGATTAKEQAKKRAALEARKAEWKRLELRRHRAAIKIQCAARMRKARLYLLALRFAHRTPAQVLEDRKKVWKDARRSSLRPGYSSIFVSKSRAEQERTRLQKIREEKQNELQLREQTLRATFPSRSFEAPKKPIQPRKSKARVTFVAVDGMGEEGQTPASAPVSRVNQVIERFRRNSKEVMQGMRRLSHELTA